MAIEELAAWAERYEAFASGLSDTDPGAVPLETVRAALAEHDQCAADLELLRRSVRAAWPLIEPTWKALVARIVPMWRQIEPLLAQDETAEAPK